tara:strand:+ start:259 stop:900 length:642 start_codon:yes stop_codon:yes gene_type:complete
MAEVNDILNDINNEKSFHINDASQNKPKWTPIIEGEYFGHITEVTTRLVEWNDKKTGNKLKSRVYNYKVIVAEENSKMQYVKPWNKEVVDGSEYAGRTIKSVGVFRNIEPNEGDDFHSNPFGNKSYLSFCNAIGVDCKEEEKEIDGKKVKVSVLPSLNIDDIEGTPVVAVVKKGKSYTDKNNNQRFYMDVKWVQRWEDGKRKKVQGKNDEIPF